MEEEEERGRMAMRREATGKEDRNGEVDLGWIGELRRMGCC